MGNACFCGKCSYKSDIQLDEELNGNKQKPIVNNKISNNNNLSEYFNEDDQEINNKKNGKNRKKFLNNAKKLVSFNTTNSKYELMLQRLLSQREKERHGPKRRTTIRADISGQEQRNLILQVINESKENYTIDYNKKTFKTIDSLLLTAKEKNTLNNKKTSADFGNHNNASNVENPVIETSCSKCLNININKKGNLNENETIIKNSTLKIEC